MQNRDKKLYDFIFKKITQTLAKEKTEKERKNNGRIEQIEKQNLLMASTDVAAEEIEQKEKQNLLIASTDVAAEEKEEKIKPNRTSQQLKHRKSLAPILELVDNNKFEEAITTLLTMKKENIHSAPSNNESNVNNSDAKNQKNRQETFHDVAIMGIKHVFAAITLLQTNNISLSEKKEDIISFLRTSTNRFLTALENDLENNADKAKFFQLYNKSKLFQLLNEIIPTFKYVENEELPEYVIIKKLGIAFDYDKLDYQSINDVTLTNESTNEEVKQIETGTECDMVYNLANTGKFIEAISQLRIMKDLKQNIHSTYSNIADNDTVYFRDARNQENTENTFHDWAIMGVNYAGAAINFLKSHNIEVSSEFLSNLNIQTANFLKDIEKSPDPEMFFTSFLHTEIIPVIEATIPKEKKKELSKIMIEERLAIVRDFGNFDHPAMSVVTRIKKDNIDLHQIDIPLIGEMINPLKSQLESLASRNENDVNAQESTPISWYDNQDDYIKFLIRKYAIDILNGKMIPTPLIKFIPGVQDSREEYILDSQDSCVLKIIQHHYYSNMSEHLFKTDKDNQTATTQYIKQIKDLTAAEHILVLTLNPSPTFYTGISRFLPDFLAAPMRKFLSYFPNRLNKTTPDDNLVTPVENAVTASNENKDLPLYHHANLPLTSIKDIFSPTQMSGADWLVARAKEKLRSLNPDEKDSEFKIDEIDNIKLELNKLLTEYEYIINGPLFPRESVSTFRGIINNIVKFFKYPENKNLQLTSVLNQLAHVVNEAHKKNPENQLKTDFVAVVFTGEKDPVGIVRIQTFIDAVKNYFTNTHLVKTIPEIEKAYINAGQVAAQAGFQGGTLGASGIKNDSEEILSSSLKKWKDILCKKTALYDTSIPKEARNFIPHTVTQKQTADSSPKPSDLPNINPATTTLMSSLLVAPPSPFVTSSPEEPETKKEQAKEIPSVNTTEMNARITFCFTNQEAMAVLTKDEYLNRLSEKNMADKLMKEIIDLKKNAISLEQANLVKQLEIAILKKYPPNSIENENIRDILKNLREIIISKSAMKTITAQIEFCFMQQTAMTTLVKDVHLNILSYEEIADKLISEIAELNKEKPITSEKANLVMQLTQAISDKYSSKIDTYPKIGIILNNLHEIVNNPNNKLTRSTLR